MKKYYEQLNKEQLEAVIHKEGPCLVLAGPGTGKTTVITSRTCQIIDKEVARAGNILVVTFSKAAAEEMKARFKKLAIDSSVNNYEGVTFGTFHSVFFRILRQYKGYSLDNLIDEYKKFSIIKSIISKLGISYFENEEQVADLINEIGYFMNTMGDSIAYQPNSCNKEHFSAILESYIELKNKLRKFDYDDMLVECYYLLKNNKNILENIRNKYKYILVDEFQDINRIQYETVKMIAKPKNNIFAVGDDDQSIYSFRGATPMIMQEFEKQTKDCKRILLRINYRTTGKILDSALALINKNTLRYSKNLDANKSEGITPITINSESFEEEAKVITDLIVKKVQSGFSYSDFAIIYRTNLQARALIDGLMDRNIPFAAVDGIMSVYNHWIYRDISSYLMLLSNSNDTDSIVRILNRPKRYISRFNIEKVSKMSGSIIDNLVNYCGLNQSQIRALDELKKNILNMPLDVKKAVNYIRKIIGYDEYLREYAYGKGIGVEGLFEIAEEIYGAACNFTNITEFLNHVEDVEKELSKKNNKGISKNRVQLMTMHRAKGLEFKTVFVGGAIEGLSPYIKTTKDEDENLEEERRLFYVALTRAKKELYICSPKHRYGKKVDVSRFLEEMIDTKKIYEDEVYKGKKIYHKIFGEGIIRETVEKNNSKRVTVDFSKSRKELDIITCIKNDIVKFLN